jgi:hypothetical protein
MKHFKFLSLMLMAIVAMFAFTACGDDDDKDNKGGQQGGGGDTSITADKLIGTWYGVDENSSKKINIFVMDFATNGKGHYAEYKAKAEENWNPRDPQYADMTWTLTKGTLNATVVVPNEGAITRKGDILSLNGNKMTVRRYLDDGYTDEIVMTRVNSADELALIFAQLILEKTGGEQGGGQGEEQGEASLLGTWKTVRIAGNATAVSTGEVLESWDKYPTLDEAKDPEKESLKYMEYTFNKDGSLKVQSFDESSREFNIIMEGTWIQNEDIVIVTLILKKNSFSKTFNIVELTADKLTLHETYIDDEFKVHGRDGRYQVVYDEYVYCTRK